MIRCPIYTHRCYYASLVSSVPIPPDWSHLSPYWSYFIPVYLLSLKDFFVLRLFHTALSIKLSDFKM